MTWIKILKVCLRDIYNMNILLDTHIVLWALSDDPALPVKAKELIEDSSNNIFYSIISLWEIELKHIARPDKLKVSAREIGEYCTESGFSLLQLNQSAIGLLSTLERPCCAPPHKDPFDRMLICQSLAGNMTFLTHDKLLGDYNVYNLITV